MSNLKSRRRFSSTLPAPLIDALDELKDLTRINKSKLLDEAIVEVIMKYKERSKMETKEKQAKFEELAKKIEDYM